MKGRAALVPFAVFATFAAGQISASTPAATSSARKSSVPAPQTQVLEPTPASVSDTAPFKPTHFFTVNDAKGLVLTCIAPEIDSNPDTDVFKSCALAPGRTLDDMMHVFIQGIHYEQSEHKREREEWLKYLEEQAAQKSAPKQ
jgi:hypothetical protein